MLVHMSIYSDMIDVYSLLSVMCCRWGSMEGMFWCLSRHRREEERNQRDTSLLTL